MRLKLGGWIAVCAVLCASPAFAVFNVSGTGIHKGLFGLELRNRFDVDGDPSKDGLRQHALKAEYGITNRWVVEMQNNWQDTPRHGYDFTSTEFENKFRFYDPGEYWLDFALKLSYEWKHQDAKADQAKIKFLFSKTFGKWAHTANINVAKEIGSDAVSDTTLSTAWQTRYALSPLIQPGIEIYNSFGELSDMPGYRQQAHRIGPMLYGTLAPGWKYQAGYLFGISNAAEDGSFKLFLKYEFPL